MELPYSHSIDTTYNILSQLLEACNLLITWNESIHSPQDYLSSPDGMRTMAASCMLIESIGEGVKKIDKLMPGYLMENEPEVPWREIKGLRDHIAHGYFDLDASIIFDVAVNEISSLRDVFSRLKSRLC